MNEFWEMPTTYINCECESELLKLVYDEEDRILYISFFNEGHSGHQENLLRRLKLICYTLKHGTPWADMICLRKGEIIKLRKYLNNLKIN